MEEIPTVFRPNIGPDGKISYVNLFDRSLLPMEEAWLRKVLLEDESVFDTLCNRYLIDKFTLFKYTVNYELLDSNIEVSADLIDEIGMDIIKNAYDCELDESTLMRIERYLKVIAEQIVLTATRSSMA